MCLLYCSVVDRVQKLHQRWVSLRSLLHSKLVTPLSTLSFPVVEERTVTRQTHTILETRLVDTNTHFRALQDAIEWCRSKLVSWQQWPPCDPDDLMTRPQLYILTSFVLMLYFSSYIVCLTFFHSALFCTKYIPTFLVDPTIVHIGWGAGTKPFFHSFICLRHASKICKQNS